MRRNIEKTKLEELFIKMNQTRFFEEKVAHLFSMGRVHGTTHLGVGQEAAEVGAVCALQKEDLIVSHHRGHGHCIAKGSDINRMMAELLGKATGFCKGKGGSMHISDLSVGNLGANGVVGGGIPIAVGAALSIQMQKKDNVVASFFGDGATNQGTFHESLNLASIWKLPVVFVCENNYYGMSMPLEKHMNISDIAERGKSYGMESITIDGNDVISVYQAMLDAKDYVKQKGPMLIVENTYRISGHSKSDANVYRSKEEIESWKKQCPIQRFRTYLLASELFSAEELDVLTAQAQADIEKTLEFAENSPEPSIDSVLEDIYA